MMECASKMLVTPDNAKEVREQLGELYSPLEKDEREVSLVTEGPLIRGRFELHALRPGLRLFAADMHVGRDSELNIKSEYPGVMLSVVLGGRRGCTVHRPSGGYDLWEFLPGRSVIGAFQPGRASCTVYGEDSHRVVDLQISFGTASQFISQYRELVPRSTPFLPAKFDGPSRHIHQALSPELTVIAYQVLNCPFDGPARRLFMESKALEILAIQLGMLSSSTLRTTAVSNKAERERLEEARRILDTEYPDPPSLLALARRVGLNDFKLKRGFRALFGTTVFGYIRRIRMENALAMLQIGALNVSEVATAMGYTCFGHFSVAFRKQYGIAPSDVKRVRTLK